MPDLTGNQILNGLAIEADLRVSSETSRTAKGLHVNFARDGVPVFDDSEGCVSSPNREGNLPEESTPRGIEFGLSEGFSDVTGVVSPRCQ